MSQQRRGVSDPARGARTRPRARLRGRSRLSCSRDRVGNAPRNDDHFPARARQRLTGATRAGFPGSNVFDECARICRRSGLDCPVALGRVKTARRSTSALRGLDPPGALPMFGNYRSDAVDSDDNRPPICRSFAHASGRLQSCPLTNHASRPHDRFRDVLHPRLVLVLHGGRCPRPVGRGPSVPRPTSTAHTRTPSTSADPRSRTKGGHRVFG
jgi:hypothetical protein